MEFHLDDNSFPFSESAATFTTFLVAALLVRRKIRKRRYTRPKHGGSVLGKSANKNIGRKQAARSIHDAYFADPGSRNHCNGNFGPVLSEEKFERRFRMPRSVYETVYSGEKEVDKYFWETKDCTDVSSASTHQKLVAALRQLSLEVSADSLTEFTRLSESTIHDCRKHFVWTVCKKFGPQYLRRPTEADLKLIMERHSKLGFPGALGSLDCSGWQLYCGAVAEQRRNIGKSKVPELRLETVFDDRLWIWHLKFGFPGALNDLNIHDCSPCFVDVPSGAWPAFKTEFKVAGRVLDWFYWVVDGIYPMFRIFLKTIPNPKTKREKAFSRSQEAFRKSVERLCAVLFSRWHILANPSRVWYTEDMDFIVRACAILHNMIIEARDVRDMGTVNIVSIDPDAAIVPIRSCVAPIESYAKADFYRDRVDSIEDINDHSMLTNALADAIWERCGKGDLDDYLECQGFTDVSA